MAGIKNTIFIDIIQQTIQNLETHFSNLATVHSRPLAAFVTDDNTFVGNGLIK